MADATNGKDKKDLNSFSADLDAMLNTGEEVVQDIDLMDDDDAIDRLLMGESFAQAEEESQPEYEEFDGLVAEDLIEDPKLSIEFDDIEEVSSADEITPLSSRESLLADLTENNQVVAEMDWQDATREPEFQEITELAQVAAIEDFTDQAELSAIDALSNEVAMRKNQDNVFPEFDISPDDEEPLIPSNTVENVLHGRELETETMVEIDDIPINPGQDSDDNLDFLLADFDISAEEVSPANLATESPPPPPTATAADLSDDPVTSGDADNLGVAEMLDTRLMDTPATNAEIVEAIPAATASLEVAEQPQPLAPAIDHSAEIADLTDQISGLTQQLTALKKLQLAFKQEITEKAANAELLSCVDAIESLQTEQKKTKRSVDAFSNQKPVAAYIANGVAATALLLGLGLAIQNYIIKTQVNEVAQLMGKFQEQLNTAPGTAAADQEVLRKELDGLAVADSVTSTQIAELKKMIGSDTPAAAPNSNQDKQITDLSAQIMQMGANIETIETKLASLEKNRVAPVQAAAAPKPEKKKPVVVEENWVVNLIAFKQDWYAKRKAEEFAAKGVVAKVSKSVAKGEDWYRLSVDGFKSQYEAAGYAAKIKKTLNLDSVWVARATE